MATIINAKNEEICQFNVEFTYKACYGSTLLKFKNAEDKRKAIPKHIEKIISYDSSDSDILLKGYYKLYK